MRTVAFALLLGLAGCSDNSQVLPVDVVWMDWPAEVAADDPFRTRIVVLTPCAVIRAFEPSPTADMSAVTFAPYFVADKEVIYCGGVVPVASDFTVNWSLDTAGMAPGLPAPSERTYEMRTVGVGISCPACAGLNTAPWSTYGVVTVRSTPPPPNGARNAAGLVMAQRDSVGCTRIRPSGLASPAAAIVLENPPDTAPQWGGFVRGYIYQPATPVCGEAKVFHML